MFWIDFFTQGLCLLFAACALGLAITIIASYWIVQRRRRRLRRAHPAAEQLDQRGSHTREPARYHLSTEQMEADMTMAQMAKRIEALEKHVRHLTELVDYQQAVEGIRRGLESADRGEGESTRKAFDRLRRKYQVRKGR